MIKVSVIIPTYNRAKLLEEALQSLLIQTYQDFEIVIVDDGSTDETSSVAKNFSCEYRTIRYFYQTNEGRSAARNRGIKMAEGEYITFLDSDDLYMENKLGVEVNALDNTPESSMVYTNYLVMDDDGLLLQGIGNPDIELSGSIYPDLLFFKGTHITTPSVMVRSNILSQSGLFDENLDMCEDLDLWRRLARLTKVIQIKEPQVVVRYRTDSLINFWKFMKGRKTYYKKAFREDPKLKPEISKALYLEMYLEYGKTALRFKNYPFAVYSLFHYFLMNPVLFLKKMFYWFFRYCKNTSIKFAQ